MNSIEVNNVFSPRHGLTEPIGHQSPVDFGKDDEILSSMEAYIDLLNAGVLDRLIAAHPRKGRNGKSFPTQASFYASLISRDQNYQCIYPTDAAGRYWWLDGNRAFAICGSASPEDRRKIIAVATFLQTSKLPEEYSPRLTHFIPANGEQSLTIVQLQGPSHGRGAKEPTYHDCEDPESEHGRAVSLLNTFQFERVATKMVTGYAMFAGAESVGMVSAAENIWYPNGFAEQVQERFRQRYDMTAQSEGFTMNEGKIHFLDLSLSRLTS